MAQRKLRLPFGTTGQGVHSGSEANPKQRSLSESEMPTIRKDEGRGLKGPGITRIRPETRRSIPGHGEAGVKPCGGQNGFYEHVFR